MLIFRPDEKLMILRHKKKQARFPGGKRWAIGKIYQAGTGIGSKPFAYLRITGLRQEFLGQISDKDARREGFPHIPGYRKAWKQNHGRWDPHQLVWVVDFEMVSEAAYLAQRKGAA